MRVDCVGIAAEIAPMNPQRVRKRVAGEDVAAEVLETTSGAYALSRGVLV